MISTPTSPEHVNLQISEEPLDVLPNSFYFCDSSAELPPSPRLPRRARTSSDPRSLSLARYNYLLSSAIREDTPPLQLRSAQKLKKYQSHMNKFSRPSNMSNSHSQSRSRSQSNSGSSNTPHALRVPTLDSTILNSNGTSNSFGLLNVDMQSSSGSGSRSPRNGGHSINDMFRSKNAKEIRKSREKQEVLSYSRDVAKMVSLFVAHAPA